MVIEERVLRLALDGGWIGVDFDGTLAEYHGWVGWNVLGKPVPRMVERVRAWRDAGVKVKIVTARVGLDNGVVAQCRVTGQSFTTSMMKAVISAWCLEHIQCAFEITCVKDVHMIELWDDRAVQVVPNTGVTLAEEHEAQLAALAGKQFGSGDV